VYLTTWIASRHRSHFLKDVRKQLYTANDDRQFFDRITDQLRDVEARLEAARAALQHLELALLNVACDDPGTPIGAQLILPLLQVGWRGVCGCVGGGGVLGWVGG
jgi:hypothetical protein